MNLSSYFKCFGFVVLRDFFGSDDVKRMRQEFDLLLDKPGLRPCFADSSEWLSQLYLRPILAGLMDQLLGPGWLYKGSDGNYFVGATPWHRDYLMQTVTAKMLVYLDDSTLDVLPGSHLVGDSYCRMVGEGLTWPEPPVGGGFEELGLYGNELVPYTPVRTSPGDVLVFRHNLVHRTSEPGRRKRRLFGLHYAAEFNNEVKQCTLIEMRTFNVKTVYGPHITRNPHTAPFFDLANDAAGDFSGQYREQTAEALEFGRRLK